MKPLVRNPVYPDDIRLSDYNTNNLYEYTPYVVVTDNSIQIDPDWFKSLSLDTRAVINHRLYQVGYHIVLTPVAVPHPVQYDVQDKKPLLAVYQSYLDGFDYQCWFAKLQDGAVPCIPSGVKLLEIPHEVKQLLLNGLDVPDQFRRELDSMIAGGEQYFVRLSSTSGKNDTPVRPYSNTQEIISHLQRCKLFRSREYSRDKPSWLILIPWNDTIDARNEFRIFVVDGVLCAASPQYWWETHNYSEDELDTIQSVLADMVHYQFIDNLPFRTFIADVYIDIANQKMNIIELNPFGAHSGAGSSLFNWENDYPQLHGLTPNAELRYLSIVPI